MSVIKKILILNLGVLSYLLFFQEDSSVSNIREVASINNNSPIGKVVYLKGKVSRFSEGLSVDDEIFQLDEIKTSKKSMVRFLMKDDTVFTVDPKSLIKFKEYKIKTKSARNINISLIKGWLHSHFKNKNRKGKISISTRNAAMGVRGTEFITYFNDNKTEMILLHGKVEVTNYNNQNRKKIKPNHYVKILKEDIIINKVEKKWIKNKIKEGSLLNSKYKFSFPNKTTFYNNKKVIKKKGKYINMINKIDREINSNKKKRVVKAKRNKRGISSIKEMKPKLVEIEEIASTTVEYKKRLLNNIVNKDLELDNKKIGKLERKIKKINETSKLFNDYVEELRKEDYSLDSIPYEISDSNEELSFENEILLKYKEREQLFKKVIEGMNKRGEALPLIDPEGNIVFFSDNPELNYLLPKDSRGNVVGIRIDYSGKIIGDFKVLKKDDEIFGVAKDDDGEVLAIPVINAFGELNYLYPIDNNFNASSIPISSKGIPLSIILEKISPENERMLEDKELINNGDER